MVEVPAARDGVMKIYVDLEMYLSKMPCIIGSSREERVEKLRALGERLPNLVSTILVDTGIISKTECVTFVIKEGSREEDNGEFKVSYHFISNLLTTSQTYPNVYATILNWIEKRCPLVMAKIKVIV